MPISSLKRDDPGKCLTRDRRGAIMVTAAFMAVFACGALWYVIGVGDAIVYRERVQDGADAVAFAGAVYHARGMNIIVTLNIIMAALLGLVVAAKLLKFLNDTANAIGCGCIPVPFIGAACSAVCTTTRAARQPINTTVDRLTQLYNKVGPILSKTQNGVAIAMPWLAEAKSVLTSQKFQPDVRFGAIVSVSLVPLGERKGLPVEDGGDDVLCGKVSSGIVDLVFDTLHLPGLVRGWIGGTLEDFVSNFCDGGELVDPEKQQEIQDREENSQVDEKCDWERNVSHALDDPFWFQSGMIIEKAKADHGLGKVDLRKLQCYNLQKDGELANLPNYSGPASNSDYTNAPEVDFETAPANPPGARPPCPFNRQLCEQRAHAEIQQRRSAEQAQNGAASGGTSELDASAREETRPKVVYHEAKNGNPYFQVWSLVLADDSRAKRPARGVEIAAHGRKQAADPSFWARLGWAQAEFYYDTDRVWDEDVASYEAMWNLRWRARLRRVNPTNVPDVLSHALGDVVGRLEDKVLEVLHGDDPGGDSLSTFTDTLVNMGFEQASQPLEDLAQQGDVAIEDEVHEQWNRFGGIH